MTYNKHNDHGPRWTMEGFCSCSVIAVIVEFGNQQFGRRLSRGWSIFGKKTCQTQVNPTTTLLSRLQVLHHPQNQGQMLQMCKLQQVQVQCFYPRGRPCAAPPVCSSVGSGCSASRPTPGSSERAPSHDSAMPDENTGWDLLTDPESRKGQGLKLLEAFYDLYMHVI